MIDYRQLYEDKRRELGWAELRVSNLEYAAKLREEHREMLGHIIDEERALKGKAWIELRSKDDLLRELQSRLDDLAHRYGVLESERNLLACTVVNAALGVANRSI